MHVISEKGVTKLSKEEKLARIAEGLNALNTVRSTYARDGEVNLRSIVGEPRMSLFSDMLKALGEFGSFGGTEFSNSLNRAGLLTESYRNLKRQYREVNTSAATRQGGADIRKSFEYLRPSMIGKGSSVLDKSMQIYDILTK